MMAASGKSKVQICEDLLIELRSEFQKRAQKLTEKVKKYASENKLSRQAEYLFFTKTAYPSFSGWGKGYELAKKLNRLYEDVARASVTPRLERLFAPFLEDLKDKKFNHLLSDLNKTRFDWGEQINDLITNAYIKQIKY